MLPTARKAYTRHASAAVQLWSQALPAESSRQALLRARRVHSHAVAAVEEQSQPSAVESKRDSYIQFKEKEWGRSGGLAAGDEYNPYAHLPAKTSKTSNVPSEWLDSWLNLHDVSALPPSPLPLLETFRGLTPTHPILALLTLPKLSHNDIIALTHNDVRQLLARSTEVAASTPAVLHRVKTEDSAKALRVLRAIIYSLPSPGSTSDPMMGRYLRGKCLRQLINLCYRLRCPALAKSIFQERLREQLATECSPSIVPFKDIAIDLARTRDWKSIVKLFSPETFPHRYYTGRLVELYMQAHLGIRQSSKVPTIFELHDVLSLEPTVTAVNHLIQAYMEMGDLPAARAIAADANSGEPRDIATQQLALLKGYRVLGLEENLEKKVLSDIERLQLPLQGALIHALARLRLNVGDIEAAETLLRKLDLRRWGGGEGEGIEGSEHTKTMLFSLAVENEDLDRVRWFWKDFAQTPRTITDEIIKDLLRILIKGEKVDDASAVLQSGLPNSPESALANEWKLPAGVRPGLQSLNFYLGAMAGLHGLSGIETAMSLFHLYRIKPDSASLKIIVDYARASLVHRPYDLAELVSSIMDVSPDLAPNPALLDSLLADAVASMGRHSNRTIAYPSILRSHSEDTFHPTAGLELSPDLYEPLASTITALESAGAQSTARTISSRLRFDAMSNSTISGVPSARIVWNSLLARGFVPDARHIQALMQGYVEIGHMLEAQDVMLLSQQMRIPTTRGMHAVLLAGYGKKRKPMLARRSYEHIKELGETDPNQGLDLSVVTAMVQAYVNCGWYKEAANLCYVDLKNLDATLDEKATIVIAQTLRANGDLRGALKVIEASEMSLGRAGAKIIRGSRQHALKQLAKPDISEDAKQEAEEVVALAQELLKERKTQEGKLKHTWAGLREKTRKRLSSAWTGMAGVKEGAGAGAAREGLRRVVVGNGKGTGIQALRARRARRQAIAKMRQKSAS
ncbi:hypothetical protein L198_01456 [Cryptococcus wingfieldii CBS 7118]|uniref:Pentatricopeptide repeat domain-containing protein n=1 Tax=Cryptococcus wingfieldii CBS 7118 TaxID=1295528 RepID=A0A1E3JZ85_9TREE|nr:hypothetical protein L198_01456 [Cryptococcus wingfieldii CBS 7118]ODO06224.1 hypothetical protein L198_01456 [Cryptococcus wingfieldii CBS 7118]